jgi:hypothetical protein
MILFQNSYFDVIPVSSKIAQRHTMFFRKDGFDVIPKNEILCYSATPTQLPGYHHANTDSSF